MSDLSTSCRKVSAEPDHEVPTMTESTVAAAAHANLRVGDLVEVLSADEIMATLDGRGELEDLPFMPEMLKFCGRQLTVHKVAHKLCDTIGGSGMHKMANAVHLTGARCDGSSHGGCQTACLLYWKEAWLKPVEPHSTGQRSTGQRGLPVVEINTRREPGPDGEPRYRCQATELLRAAPTCLPSRDLTQYVTDVTTGNVSAVDSLRAFLVALFNRLQDMSKRFLPSRFWFREGMHWRFVKGRIAAGPTPTEYLDLQPGELVRIKSKEQIEATLNSEGLNRGMGFDAEMARYCGRTARVRARVTRCLDEKTGRLLTMKNPCIALDDVVCAGGYNANCPREFVCFWREIWLERV